LTPTTTRSPPDAYADTNAERVRADGARVWYYNLVRDTPHGPQLRYWVYSTCLIEFEDLIAREAAVPRVGRTPSPSSCEPEHDWALASATLGELDAL
jgi:hypothetical protein